MALEGEVDDRVEQRMAGADEGGQRLAVRRDQRLLEGDALVARQHRLADADQAVAVAHRRRDVGDLVAARLALLGRAAQPLEGLEEERLDVVRLQAAGLGALHVLADAVDPAGVHGVVGQRALFEQVLELAAVERVFDAPSSGGRAPRAGRRSGWPRSAGRAAARPRTGACRARRRPGRRAPCAPARASPAACDRRRPRASRRRPGSRGGRPRSGRCGGCGRSAARAGWGSRAGRS